MATSLETFTKESVEDLNIIPIYKELMEASTGENSVFLRAKETLVDLLASNGLTTEESAVAIATAISSISSNVTSSAMTTALAITKDNRDAAYELAKLREDTILVQENQHKIASDVESTDNEVKNKVYEGWKAQGELVRDYGVNAFNLATTTDVIPEAQYNNNGLKYEANRLAKANTYNTYASSYRGNGYVTVNLNADGSLANTVTGDTNGLVTAQTAVAVRQEVGFDDNMRQHVANSSASMMSMLLSTEASGIDYAPYLAKWSTSIDYLNEV